MTVWQMKKRPIRYRKSEESKMLQRCNSIAYYKKFTTKLDIESPTQWMKGFKKVCLNLAQINVFNKLKAIIQMDYNSKCLSLLNRIFAEFLLSTFINKITNNKGKNTRCTSEWNIFTSKWNHFQSHLINDNIFRKLLKTIEIFSINAQLYYKISLPMN